jgi:hypothetical protein
VIGAAVRVMRSATGEEEETTRAVEAAAKRKGGLKGGKARAVGSMTAGCYNRN